MVLRLYLAFGTLLGLSAVASSWSWGGNDGGGSNSNKRGGEGYTGFKFVGSSCSRGVMSLSYEKVGCGSFAWTSYGNECSAGSVIKMNGLVSLQPNDDGSPPIPDNTTVQIKFCKYHHGENSFLCLYDKKFYDVDICSRANLYSIVYSCPYAPATYKFRIEESLPEGADLNLGSGYSVYLEAYLWDQDSNSVYEHCTVQFEAVKLYRIVTWGWGMAGAAAIVSAVVCGAYGSRRRRRLLCARLSLEDLESAGDDDYGSKAPSSSNFLEMEEPRMRTVV